MSKFLELKGVEYFDRMEDALKAPNPDNLPPFNHANQSDRALLELLAQEMSQYQMGDRVTNPHILELLKRLEVSSFEAQNLFDFLLDSIIIDGSIASEFPRSHQRRQ